MTLQFPRSRRIPPTRFARCALIVALIALTTIIVSGQPQAQAQRSTCFGSTPTLVAVRGQTTIGTPGADVIVGTAGPDVIRGRGGADKICSRGGADLVFGGAGADSIRLGTGNDRASGGSGRDLIRGGKGGDVLRGNSGTDNLRGNGGSDTLFGGRGADKCNGGMGIDQLAGCNSTGARFETLAPGAALPSEAACAARVRPTPEVRPGNRSYNSTRGTSAADTHPRVTGNFTGTTDEIIQWAACKHGIDEDLARAQLTIESWWDQTSGGDETRDQALCHPQVRTTSGPCAQSQGMGQIKFQYHGAAYEDANALRSTAYNVDYTYGFWRECFEGRQTWLNTVERGSRYTAGDALGCMGVWFSGRWHTAAADGYIERVTGTLADRTWETRNFRAG